MVGGNRREELLTKPRSSDKELCGVGAHNPEGWPHLASDGETGPWRGSVVPQTSEQGASCYCQHLWEIVLRLVLNVLRGWGLEPTTCLGLHHAESTSPNRKSFLPLHCPHFLLPDHWWVIGSSFLVPRFNFICNFS